jgi:hypothetical protein
MTPVSWLWLWRGLTGYSVTFALLFASLILGGSIAKATHHLFSALGFSWLLAFLLPLLLFRWLSNQEARWWPDVRMRRRVALGIIFGSTAVAMAIARFAHR